ncbi:hypothetical protein LJC56_08615 [Christensenellaceae bacterium OttesenSCG-928-K19]|nr:hypothetical protein [Christensenellaceae bacterium OttesenSCG-928-K19]
MGLLKSSIQRELDKGLKLVNKEKDLTKLKEIALNHYYHPEVRLAAAEKTADPSVLLELALKADVGPEFSMAIAEKAQDDHLAQTIYASAAKWYPGNMGALEKISEPSLLVDVAKNALDIKIIFALAKKQDGPSILNQAVLYHKEDSIRLKIIEKIIDEDTLKRLRHVNLYSKQVREAATKQWYDVSGTCLHNFVYGPSHHPDNTGRTVSEGKCTICGFVEEQEGWDDSW